MICLDIKPINDERLTCFERPLCVVASWVNRDYEPLFLGGFSFSQNYVKSYNCVTEVQDMLVLMKTYTNTTGIKVNICHKDNFDYFQSIVINMLKHGLPIMTFIDSYWCPWYPSYKTSHIKHYILIIGINEENNEYYCLDRYDETNYIRILPFSDIENGRGEYFTFYVKPDFSPCLNDYIKILRSNLLSVNNSSYCMWNNMLKFKQDLMFNFDMISEVKDVHTYKVASIYTWLKGISNSRSKLKDSLIWLNKTYHTFFSEDILNLLDESYKKWWKIILLLIKVLSSETKIEYCIAANTVEQIILLEKEIYTRLLELCDESYYL